MYHRGITFRCQSSDCITHFGNKPALLRGDYDDDACHNGFELGIDGGRRPTLGGGVSGSSGDSGEISRKLN
jgi:hypothetical protein